MKLHPKGSKSLSKNYRGGSEESNSKIADPSQNLTLIWLEHTVEMNL